MLMSTTLVCWLVKLMAKVRVRVPARKVQQSCELRRPLSGGGGREVKMSEEEEKKDRCR